MNILISNVYSWKNKGDAAIILCMINHIKKEFPGATISISSIDPEDKGKYGEKYFDPSFLRIVKNLYNPKNNNILFLLKYFIQILTLRMRLKLFAFLAKKRVYWFGLFDHKIQEKIKKYQNYDLVIAAGGGYFISKENKRKVMRLFNYDEQVLFAYDFYLATFFGKPYILYNQSIGPFFSKKDALNLQPFFKNAEAIICRERLTYNRMKAAGINNLILSEDAAFNLKSTKNGILDKYTKTENEISIGFTVRKCLPNLLQKKYENEISIFIAQVLSSSSKTKIYFMPQVTYEKGGDNDLHVVRRIHESINKNVQDRVMIIDENVHPGDLKYIIGEMDYFFGTRMHSCIFALASNIKTIALSYEPKTDGIMKSLKVDNYFINVKEVNAEKLLDLYQQVTHDQTYQTILKKEVERVQKESLVNLKEILGIKIEKSLIRKGSK